MRLTRSPRVSLLCPVLICLYLALPSFGQVEIQWITKASSTPTLVSGQNLAISKPTSVQILVTGVNDFLYDHEENQDDLGAQDIRRRLQLFGGGIQRCGLQ